MAPPAPLARLARLTTALLLAWLAAPCVAPSVAKSFPCAADQWVDASWRGNASDAVCRSCFECVNGQECRRRGGCANCTKGEVDDDDDPLTACVLCPKGKTSEEGATLCTKIEQDVWERAADAWSAMDTWAQAVCGTGLGALVLGVGTWCCAGCKGGSHGLCRELGKRCGSPGRKAGGLPKREVLFVPSWLSEN